MKLKKVHSIELLPTAPFNFDATFHKPDHFTSGDNEWEKGIRWQTWYWVGKQLGLKFVNKGTNTKPRIKVDIYFTKKLDEASQIRDWRKLFGSVPVPEECTEENTTIPATEGSIDWGGTPTPTPIPVNPDLVS